MYKIVTKSWIKHFDFILWDLVCMEVSLYLAFIARHGMENPFNISIYRTLFILIIFVNFALTLFFNIYSDVLKRGYYQEFVKTLQMAVSMVLVITLIIFFIKESDFSRFTIGLFGFLYLFISYVVRILWKKLILKINQNRGARGRSILVIASRNDMKEMITGITENGTNAYYIAGLVLTDEVQKITGENQDKTETILDVPVVATLDTLADYAKVNWVDEAIVMIGDGDHELHEKLQLLSTMGITVHTCIDQKNSLQGTKQTYSVIGKVPAMTYSINYMTPLQSIAKRVMDLVIGLIGIVIMGIAMIFIAPIILIQSPGPLFFVQKRVGRNGKIFNFYKFRSMYVDAEERKKELMDQNEVKDGLMFKMEFDPRVIGNRIDENGNKKYGIGNFIRKYSIDELPQFINVLKGDMSVVGTRPPTVQEYEKYEAHHKVRLAIKPGLTGMWQVSGRSNIKDFEEVVRLDTEYINTWSIGLDFKIIFKTFKVVLKHEGSM